jgi:fibronectin-binding autotransporter adhesin
MLGTMNATTRGMLGWRHTFGDDAPLSTHGFAGGDDFTIAGDPIPENAAVIEAGLDLRTSPNSVLSLSYSGQIASDSHEHGFKADFTVKF